MSANTVKKQGNQPGQGLVNLTNGVMLEQPVRILRFDQAGSVTITDADGTVSSTLNVLAAEKMPPGNYLGFTAVSYTGAVTGWN